MTFGLLFADTRSRCDEIILNSADCCLRQGSHKRSLSAGRYFPLVNAPTRMFVRLCQLMLGFTHLLSDLAQIASSLGFVRFLKFELDPSTLSTNCCRHRCSCPLRRDPRGAGVSRRPVGVRVRLHPRGPVRPRRARVRRRLRGVRVRRGAFARYAEETHAEKLPKRVTATRFWRWGSHTCFDAGPGWHGAPRARAARRGIRLGGRAGDGRGAEPHHLHLLQPHPAVRSAACCSLTILVQQFSAS